MTDGQSDRCIRLAILGPARCGKDTAKAWFLEHTELRGELSTSEWYEFVTMEESPEDLEFLKSDAEGRRLLGNSIRLYNQTDGTGCRLYRDMADAGYTLFSGIRRLEEIAACKQAGIVTHAIWLWRPGCEDATCELTWASVADLFDNCRYIENDGTLAGLYIRLDAWWKSLVSLEG